MNIAAYIEMFHLLFLRQLESKLDKKLYSLKGGCNLRFFFKSIRYSEDIDFDVTIISKATLENKINKIFDNTSFKKILAAKDIESFQIHPSKQTETTQRWKVLLRIKNSAMPIPTKIEFSRRKIDAGVSYESIDADIIHRYHLYPIFCNHYEMNTAFLQKIDALIHRTETQARDIFDLKWLLSQGVKPNLNSFSKNQIKTAINNIESISYADYKGHVIAFLMNEYKEIYDSEKKWNNICDSLIQFLQG